MQLVIWFCAAARGFSLPYSACLTVLDVRELRCLAEVVLKRLCSDLQRFTAAEYLEGDNKYRCPKQRKAVRAAKRMSIEVRRAVASR